MVLTGVVDRIKRERSLKGMMHLSGVCTVAYKALIPIVSIQEYLLVRCSWLLPTCDTSCGGCCAAL
jgi:hypothetical protein